MTEVAEREYPTPAISMETEAYWAAANEGKLLMKRCTDCKRTPYAIAYVTVDEGITMLSNIVECDYDGLSVGQTVEVTFRKSSDGEQSVPVFRPA